MLSHRHLFDPDGISLQIRLHRRTEYFTLRNFAPPRQNDVNYFHNSICFVYRNEYRPLSTSKDPTTRIPNRRGDTGRQRRCNHSIRRHANIHSRGKEKNSMKWNGSHPNFDRRHDIPVRHALSQCHFQFFVLFLENQYAVT